MAVCTVCWIPGEQATTRASVPSIATRSASRPAPGSTLNGTPCTLRVARNVSTYSRQFGSAMTTLSPAPSRRSVWRNQASDRARSASCCHLIRRVPCTITSRSGEARRDGVDERGEVPGRHGSRLRSEDGEGVDWGAGAAGDHQGRDHELERPAVHVRTTRRERLEVGVVEDAACPCRAAGCGARAAPSADPGGSGCPGRQVGASCMSHTSIDASVSWRNSTHDACTPAAPAEARSLADGCVVGAVAAADEHRVTGSRGPRLARRRRRRAPIRAPVRRASTYSVPRSRGMS